MNDLNGSTITKRGLPQLEDEELPSRTTSSVMFVSSRPIFRGIAVLSAVLVASGSGKFLWNNPRNRSVSSTPMRAAPATVESGRVQTNSGPSLDSPQINAEISGRDHPFTQPSTRKKRKAYVHIGPHKTGSTALQKALLNDYKKQMMEDDFFSPSSEDLPGTFRGPEKAHATLAACMSTNCGKPPNCHPLLWNETLPAFMEKLKTTRNGNIPKRSIGVKIEEEPASLFLSAEGFYSPCIDTGRLRDLLADYHVTIVALYRPFYEWIISMHSQNAREAYPVLGVGFLDWINEPSTFHRFERKLSVFEESYTSPLKEDGSSLFEEMIVLDYTEVKKQDAGLPAVVACDVLDAGETCKAIHQEVVEEEAEDHSGMNSFTNVNVFQAIDYQRIVEAGWAQGIVGTESRTYIHDALTDFERLIAEQNENPHVKSQMAKTVKSLKRYRGRKADELQSWWERDQGKSLVDLPRECVDNSILDQIKEYSWKHYMRMRPYLLQTSQNDKDVVESTRYEMDRHVEAQHSKLCSVNVDAVLLDPSWQDMLYS